MKMEMKMMSINCYRKRNRKRFRITTAYRQRLCSEIRARQLETAKKTKWKNNWVCSL